MGNFPEKFFARGIIDGFLRDQARKAAESETREFFKETPMDTCRYCKGTGQVTLLTSSVPCDCVKTNPNPPPTIPWLSEATMNRVMRLASIGVGPETFPDLSESPDRPPPQAPTAWDILMRTPLSMRITSIAEDLEKSQDPEDEAHGHKLTADHAKHVYNCKDCQSVIGATKGYLVLVEGLYECPGKLEPGLTFRGHRLEKEPSPTPGFRCRRCKSRISLVGLRSGTEGRCSPVFG